MRLYAIAVLIFLVGLFFVYLWFQNWKYRAHGLPAVERDVRGDVTLEDLGGEYDGR
jgi:hypothetical protein